MKLTIIEKYFKGFSFIALIVPYIYMKKNCLERVSNFEIERIENVEKMFVVFVMHVKIESISCQYLSTLLHCKYIFKCESLEKDFQYIELWSMVYEL